MRCGILGRTLKLSLSNCQFKPSSKPFQAWKFAYFHKWMVSAPAAAKAAPQTRKNLEEFQFGKQTIQSQIIR